MKDPRAWAVDFLQLLDAFVSVLPCPEKRDPRAHAANCARLREDTAHALRGFVTRLGQYPDEPQKKAE